MIVLSFLLVVIAAVTLLVGLFQDTLTWIWVSIGSCVLAMVFLGIGVLQRRSTRGEPREEEAAPGYGPGAISSLMTGEEEEEEEVAAAPAEEVTVVPKRSASDARGEMTRAEVEDAADEAVARAEAEAEEAPPTATAEEAPREEAAKEAAKKATKKKTARKEAAKETTGAAAQERLAEIKGLGPAKQKVLLDEFGSLEAIRDADVATLQEVKGIGEATAKAIRDALS